VPGPLIILATVTVLCSGSVETECAQEPPFNSSESGGRGAGNGVAARSQLYEGSNRKRLIAGFIGFDKRNLGQSPSSSKVTPGQFLETSFLFGLPGALSAGSEDLESGQ
jgi:hypothetical protein